MLDALHEDVRVIIVHKKLVHSLEQSCCEVLIKARPSCCSKTTHGNSVCHHAHLSNRRDVVFYAGKLYKCPFASSKAINRMRDYMIAQSHQGTCSHSITFLHKQ